MAPGHLSTPRPSSTTASTTYRASSIAATRLADDPGQNTPSPTVGAGLPDTVRTYELGHTHASLLIDLGASSPSPSG